MKQGDVYRDTVFAGIIEENIDGEFLFTYDATYLRQNSEPISLTLPLQTEAFQADSLFPFFDGLIPEGWLLQCAVKHWKLNRFDRMSLLLTTCENTIGNISIRSRYSE